MKIAMCCAKVAYDLKETVKAHLLKCGHEVVDFCDDPSDPMPYAEVAARAAEGMLNSACELGVFFCGTGMGVSLVANMFKGITAAPVESKFAARRARYTNNANVLCLGSFILGPVMACEMVDEFLKTSWLEGADEATRAVLKGQLDFIGTLENEKLCRKTKGL